MSLVVTAAGAEGKDFLAKTLGLEVTPKFRAIQAHKEATGEVVGMVGFDRWTDNCAEMHIWLRNPLALRALLWPAFHYLFNEAGRGIALGVVDSRNSRALELNAHVGFSELARITDAAAPGADLVLLEMRKENCRWLKRPLRRVA